MRAGLAAWGVAAAFLAGAPSAAHHGTSQYDMGREIELKGTVGEWRFSNPHAWLVLEVTGADGIRSSWSIESAPLRWLERNGWSAMTLAPGEAVTVKISPARQEQRAGIMREVTRENGETRVIRRPGQAAP